MFSVIVMFAFSSKQYVNWLVGSFTVQFKAIVSVGWYAKFSGELIVTFGGVVSTIKVVSKLFITSVL